MKQARIVEICTTLHGELPYMGAPCFLIRFTGCNLNCSYCDTKREEVNQTPTVSSLMDKVYESKLDNILITGGEPLIQKPFITEFMERLIEEDKKIIVETNGTLPFEDIVHMATFVQDIKLDIINKVSVSEVECINLESLTGKDAIKIIFWDDDSFYKALNVMENYKRAVDKDVLWILSPAFDVKNKGKYAYPFIKFSKSFNRNLRFQIQMHKYIDIA